MSGIAQIFPNAELNPTKAEIAKRFGAIVNVEGSARIADPAHEVGIEIILGTDESGRLMQLPMTYRPSPVDEQGTLTEMEHSELGKRWVTAALSDNVAVTEIIRTIVQGDDGAQHSDGPPPAFLLRGSGNRTDAKVVEAQIAESTRQRAVGTVTIDDQVRGYLLRMTNLPHPAQSGGSLGTDYSTARLRLTARRADDSEAAALVIAELIFPDGLS